jgi:hypothetical protein
MSEVNDLHNPADEVPGPTTTTAQPAAASNGAAAKKSIKVEADAWTTQSQADAINRSVGEKPRDNFGKGNALPPQHKTPVEREKKPVEGASPNNGNLSEMFNRGQQGKVLDDKFVAETDALKGLHAERAAAVTNKAGDDAIKIIDDKIKNATQALEPKTKAFGDLTMPQRAAASMGGNFGKNVSNIEKGIRGAGAVVGLGSIISGTKQLVSPEVDENGERKSGVGKQLGKIAGGAAIVYASLVHGGANKAMGFAKV